VLTRPTASLRSPPAASQRQCPYTPAEHPPSGAQLDEASLRVHCIHPSGLPLACGPRMERAPLGFLPELRTPPLPATHVRVGTGLEHWPGTTQSTSSVDPPSYESTRIVRPRVAPCSCCCAPTGTSGTVVQDPHRPELTSPRLVPSEAVTRRACREPPGIPRQFTPLERPHLAGQSPMWTPPGCIQQPMLLRTRKLEADVSSRSLG